MLREREQVMLKKDENVIALTQSFAKWLLALRTRLRVTQVELANILHVMPQPISRWENGRELPITINLIRLLALATPEERAALIDKGEVGLDDTLKMDVGTHLELVNCADCGRPLRVRDFTRKGWPAPPIMRRGDDPFAVKECPTCDPRL